jgi:dimethylamine monooxygenase subunit A
LQIVDLPFPPRYFPITRGRYETAANLSLLGRDFGYGARDALAIQLDSEFPVYRAGKLAARAESLSKYVGEADCTAHCEPDIGNDPAGGLRPGVLADEGELRMIQAAVARMLIGRCTLEHPDHFSYHREERTLDCRLTGERLHFGGDLSLTSVEGGEGVEPPYVSAFDALCCQIQEDVAIVHVGEDGDRVCAVHVCSPSGWAPREKLGLSFPAVHAPVAGIEAVSRISAALMKGAVDKGPFIRFGWGIAGDALLNRHPEPPPGIAPEVWRVPAYNAACPESPFVLRVERQVMWGLPEVRAFVFFIRVYTIPGSEVRANEEWREQLASALRTMPEDSACYKGLEAHRETLIAFLKSGSSKNVGTLKSVTV